MRFQHEVDWQRLLGEGVVRELAMCAERYTLGKGDDSGWWAVTTYQRGAISTLEFAGAAPLPMTRQDLAEVVKFIVGTSAGRDVVAYVRQQNAAARAWVEAFGFNQVPDAGSTIKYLLDKQRAIEKWLS